MVLKLYMDIFLIKTQCFRRPLLTPWSCMDHFYDGWMHFLGVQNLRHHSLPFIKLGRARIVFNKTDCFCLKEGSHIGWLEGE